MVHLSASSITALHDRSNTAWHRLETASAAMPDPLATMPVRIEGDPLLSLVAAQHLTNYRLWHVEDLARLQTATTADIARAKRTIDRINQQRNDLAEQVDALLLAETAAHAIAASTSIPLHSETPGMMIDRLSILSLKMYHTQEEVDRMDAPVGHAARNQERLQVLKAQRSDLATCLDQLWQAVLAGERRFNLYYQMKMYNDPSLNPALYQEPQTVGQEQGSSVSPAKAPMG